MTTILAIFLGGGLGSILRFIISKLNPFVFPIGTLLANVLSCIVLAGTIAFFSSKIEASNFWKAFVIIGFCGGFSTFSTFSFETYTLLKADHLILAILNILVSIIFCLAVFYIVKPGIR